MVAGFAAAVCVAATAFAGDGTWTGATSTDLCVGSNWSGGEVPTGAATISVASATTLTCSGEFSPTSIIFGPDSALVTISGAGCVTNIHAIMNSTALNHEFKVPVTFPDAMEADIPLGLNDSIVFSGGMTAYSIKPKLEEYPVDASANAVYAYIRGRVTLTKENDDYNSAVKGLYQIPGGTTLTVNGAVNSGTASFRLGSGATLIIDGDFVATKTSGWSYICYQNHHSAGTIKINGKVYANNTGVTIGPYHRHNNPAKPSGKFYVSGLVVAKADGINLNGRNSDDVTVDGGKSTNTNRWYIGKDGLSATRTVGRYIIPNDGGGAILTAMEDFTISAPINPARGTSLAFVTTNPESGENHKVTISATIIGSGSAITVSGSGEVLYTVSATQTGTMTVNDAATVSANAGIKPISGPVNLNDTSTLKVAQSGTMTLTNLLTAAAGTTLAFNFSNPTTPPAISASGGLALPESGVVNVKVTADNDNFAHGTYTIISGAGLTDGDLAKFRFNRKLTDDLRGELSISGGDLILKVLPKPGTKVIIR